MTTRKKLVTAEGDEIPDIDPKSDVGQLIYLLEYARKRGFHIGPTVKIGAVVVQVADLRQTEGKPPAMPEVDVWTAHGHVERPDSTD